MIERRWFDRSVFNILFLFRFVTLQFVSRWNSRFLFSVRCRFGHSFLSPPFFSTHKMQCSFSSYAKCAAFFLLLLPSFHSFCIDMHLNSLDFSLFSAILSSIADFVQIICICHATISFSFQWFLPIKPQPITMHTACWKPIQCIYKYILLGRVCVWWQRSYFKLSRDLAFRMHTPH